MKINKSINISINSTGKVNLDQLPDNFKKFIEDKDNNGMPDFVEESIKEVRKNSSVKIQVNGKEYKKWKDVPEEARSEFFFEDIDKHLDNKDRNKVSRKKPRGNLDKTRAVIFIFLFALIAIYLFLSR